MTWPTTFANLTAGSQPLSLFDGMFNQVAAMIEIPSSVAGTNAISATPLVNCPVVSSYTEFMAFRFRAAGNSTGAVTAQFNGLGFLNVYHADGVTQASSGDLINAQEYVCRFSQALNGGIGGWFLESPAAPLATQTYFQPGGRLTIQSGVPVITATVASSSNIWYAPYAHPFVPIYNGSVIQPYQFTSSQSDIVGPVLAMGGAANWPAGSAHDVFMTLIGGVPTLCTVQWTNLTTRATNLAIFGGILTNGGSATALRTGPTSFTLPVNQGTFLGSFGCPGGGGQGTTTFTFGSAASGGGISSFNVCNYYNKVLFNSIVTDNGASYTYTAGVARIARASINNSHNYMQSDSERAALFSYNWSCTTAAAAGANVVLGPGLGVTFISVNQIDAPAAFAMVGSGTAYGSVSSTGFTTVNALELGDAVNANTFNRNSSNQLFASIWL